MVAQCRHFPWQRPGLAPLVSISEDPRPRLWGDSTACWLSSGSLGPCKPALLAHLMPREKLEQKPRNADSTWQTWMWSQAPGCPTCVLCGTCQHSSAGCLYCGPRWPPPPRLGSVEGQAQCPCPSQRVRCWQGQDLPWECQLVAPWGTSVA